MKDNYRVGCFDATFEGDTAKIRHDSMDEPLELDFQEIHDLDDILSLLHLRQKAENDVVGAQERLETLADNLEA